MNAKENGEVFYYRYSTEIGELVISCDGDAITGVRFASSCGEVTGKNVRTPLTDKAADEIREYLAGKRKTFDLPLTARGTEFQQKVWRALCDIPYGGTRSYADVAAAVGNPKAVRAVGMANHNNPIAIILPCHRVIGKSGKPVGYAGGVDVKLKLLELERRVMTGNNAV